MRMLIKILLILLLISVCQAAQVVRYVDPDAVGGGTGVDWANAYTSLSAWDAAEGTNLVTDGDYHTVYCRSSSGTDDTTALTIGGWTTGAANYIEIIGSDFPSDGVYDDTKYVIKTTNGTTITVNEDYVRIRNLQIQLTITGSSAAAGISLYSIGASSDVRIDSCIVKGVDSSSNAVVYGIRPYDTSLTAKIYDCVVYGFNNAAGHTGIYFQNGTSSCVAYNNTVYDCYVGIAEDSCAATITNCISGNNNDDFSGGALTIDHCCSDDGDGTNAQTPSGGSWANEFTNAAGEDFSLLVGGNCVGNGTDDPGSGLYSDDIIGTARSSTWDIGAFEYEAAAPPAGGGQVIIITGEI